MSVRRRQFVKCVLGAIAGVSLASLLAPPAVAMGEKSKVRFATLKLGDGWNCRPDAARGLLSEVNLRTSVRVSFQTTQIAPDDDALSDNPLLFLCGDKAFELPPDAQLKRLSAFLRYGGMIVIDSATGEKDDGFDRSARKLAAALLPAGELAKVPFSHTFFRAFYRIRRVAGRVDLSDSLEGIELEDRLAILYSMDDLHGAWAMDRLGQYTMQPAPGGESQRQLALSLGVNTVMYALTVNYKSDQVHTTYRLMQRGRRF